MPHEPSLNPDKTGRSHRSAGLKRALRRPVDLREGIYEFNYAFGSEAGSFEGRGLAMLRAGSVLGSDEWGGVFSGSYALTKGEACHRVRVTLKVPPFAELVTGYRAGPHGRSFHLDCRFPTPEPKACASVSVEGVRVAIELVYIGAVPTT